MGSPRKSDGAAPSGGRLFLSARTSVNERVAEALHRRVFDELGACQGSEKSFTRASILADYTKKVLDHLVMLEEEVQDLHRRNHQLSRRLRALQNRVDTARRKG